MAKAAARTKNAKAKSTKKFIQKGHLGRTIKERKQKQDIRRKIDNRKALRGKPAAHTLRGDEDEEDGAPDHDQQKQLKRGGAAAAAAQNDDNDESGDEM